MNHYYIFNTDWGKAGIVINQRGIRCFEFPQAGGPEMIRKKLLKKCPSAVPGPKSEKGLVKEIIESIRKYFKGAKVDLDFPVDFSCSTPFQKKVYQHLKKVGYGKVKSYKQLAESIGAPEAARAVAGAVARNPVGLIIPCHRIIRSDGSIGGFSAPGGIKTKKRLLDLEAGSAD